MAARAGGMGLRSMGMRAGSRLGGGAWGLGMGAGLWGLRSEVERGDVVEGICREG